MKQNNIVSKALDEPCHLKEQLLILPWFSMMLRPGCAPVWGVVGSVGGILHRAGHSAVSLFTCVLAPIYWHLLWTATFDMALLTQ